MNPVLNQKHLLQSLWLFSKLIPMLWTALNGWKHLLYQLNTLNGKQWKTGGSWHK